MRLHIDLETFSRADLKKVGVYRYAQDPSTEILCMSWAATGESGIVRRGRFDHANPVTPDFVEFYSNPALVKAAHNANFERVLLSTHAGRKFLGADKKTRPIEWVCTAAKSAAMGLPRALEDVAEALGLPAQKDKEGAAVMRKLSKPRRPTKADPSDRYTPASHPELFATLYSYCDTDVDVEVAIDTMLPDMPREEQALYAMDQTINDRGLLVDVVTARKVLDLYELYDNKLSEEAVAISGCSVRQVKESLAWLASRGTHLEALDAENVQDALKLPLPDDVRRFIEIRAELAKSSIGKYTTMLAAACNDDRVRGMFLFYGAGTGRWSGRLVQLQNLPRGSFDEKTAAQDVALVLETLAGFDTATSLDIIQSCYGSVTGVLSSMIRAMFMADAGHDIAQCDYASIEARVLGWLAADPHYQAAFKAGKDLYIVTASHIFGVDYDKVTKSQRQLGKQAVLGLGYGMGLEKFIATCEKVGVVAEHELYVKAHRGYRELYAKIVSYWADLNRAATEAVARKSSVAVKRGAVQVVFYWKEIGTNWWLMCRLPSGRDLAYFKPRLTDGKYGAQVEYYSLDSMTKKFRLTHGYGGKWCENIVQAVARDLLRDAMPVVEKAGFKIIGHVHDELITLCPAGTKSASDIESAMSELPEWAEGCIVGAAGEIMSRYKK